MFLKGVALLIIVGLLALIGQLGALAAPAFAKFGFSFFAVSTWNPVTEKFGTLAFIWGTLVYSLLSLLLAAPISIAVALFLNEVAPRFLGTILGFMVEMLAAIPSVVYGIWGIFWLAPFMRGTIQPFLKSWLGWLPLFQGPPYGVGMLTAGLILAIMIIPFIASEMRDVFAITPPMLKESAYGLGATTWEVMWHVVFPYTKTGVVGGIMLGQIGRAHV